MIARVPEFAQDLSWWAAFAIGGAGVAWRVVRCLKSWMTSELGSKLDQIAERVELVEHLTRYHLGPNGESPKLHERIAILEANSIRRRSDDPQTIGATQ